MANKLMAFYGLKFNPFHSDVPIEALLLTKRVESFIWRVENLVMDGGIAMMTGDPGFGKSATLRLLDARLSEMRDITVATLVRPQSGLADFYRELGSCFGVELRVSNRWGGYQALRDKWRRHIDKTLMRPVLLVDEAQEMLPVVLSELRLLAADRFDARKILTVVLAGDSRLEQKLKHPDLIPLASRIRTKLHMEARDPRELTEILDHVVESAGNKQLLTGSLKETLVEHAMGSPRVMMHMAEEVLAQGAIEEKSRLDETLFFSVMERQLPQGKRAPRRRTGA